MLYQSNLYRCTERNGRIYYQIDIRRCGVSVMSRHNSPQFETADCAEQWAADKLDDLEFADSELFA